MEWSIKTKFVFWEGSPLKGILLIVLVNKVWTADYCYVDGELQYCNYGCCGNDCCGLNAVSIVGMVLGALFALAAMVGCVICLVCLCKKNSGQGNYVQPYNNNTSSVVVHNTTPYHHPPPRAPQSYNQYSSYPGGSYGFNDSVYPPGFLQNDSHPPPAYPYSDPQTGRK